MLDIEVVTGVKSVLVCAFVCVCGLLFASYGLD